MNYGVVLSNYLRKFREMQEKTSLYILKDNITVRDVFVLNHDLRGLYVSAGRLGKMLDEDQVTNVVNHEQLRDRLILLRDEILKEISKTKQITTVDQKASLKEKSLVFDRKGRVNVQWQVLDFVKNYSEDLKGVEGLKMMYKKIGNDDVTNFGDIDKSQMMDALSAMIVIAQDFGKRPTPERKLKAMYRLHHELQIPPHFVRNLLSILGIDYNTIDIMTFSNRYFMKIENKPEWLMKMELSQ